MNIYGSKLRIVFLINSDINQLIIYLKLIAQAFFTQKYGLF